MKILIIDDNESHSELAARRLKKEGWEVVTTDSNEPNRSFEKYDFILLDYSMPQRSGLEVLKLMQDLELRTPVIFLTGHGNEIIASEAIKMGAYDYVVKDTQLLYLDRLPSIMREAKSKHELIETNRFLIQELKRANERLEKLTIMDEMTGVYNYRFIKTQMEKEIQRSVRYDKDLSICLIDVDNFKSINDKNGHPVGDHVLKTIANQLKEMTRASDFVGRYGGDEFIVIFPDTKLADAVRLAERVRSSIKSLPITAHGKTVSTSLSIGVADLIQKDRDCLDKLVEAADRCLYKAKQGGRNKVVSMMRLINTPKPKQAQPLTN